MKTISVRPLRVASLTTGPGRIDISSMKTISSVRPLRVASLTTGPVRIDMTAR
jgi:hypothetical protein